MTGLSERQIGYYKEAKLVFLESSPTGKRKDYCKANKKRNSYRHDSRSDTWITIYQSLKVNGSFHKTGYYITHHLP